MNLLGFKIKHSLTDMEGGQGYVVQELWSFFHHQHSARNENGYYTFNWFQNISLYQYKSIFLEFVSFQNVGISSQFEISFFLSISFQNKIDQN
jgi:hypothetical protein